MQAGFNHARNLVFSSVKTITLNESKQIMKYWILLFGSDPAHHNDDCWIGKSFQNYNEALVFFIAWKSDEVFSKFNKQSEYSALIKTADESGYIFANDSELVCLKKNEDFIPAVVDNTDWNNEFNIQQKMSFGLED